MMLFSFERNKSSIPLSCCFTLGFIPSPQNKIARFQRSPRPNLAISHHKNQYKSQTKCYFFQFLTEDSLVDRFRRDLGACATLTSRLKTFETKLVTRYVSLPS